MFKNRFANKCGERKKRVRSLTSLSQLEQLQIMNYVNQFPFDNAIKIKNNLQLRCNSQTIRNLLKRNGIKP
jgi:hypothetical protein